jgi:hypothetical protein
MVSRTSPRRVATLIASVRLVTPSFSNGWPRCFDAELGLARTKRNELLSLVQLYRALGGGWQS